MEATYPLADFEGGVRCMECNRDIPEGSPYAESLYSVCAGGVPVLEIVCVYCAAKVPPVGRR